METLGYCAEEDVGEGRWLVFKDDRVTTPDGSTFRVRLDPSKEPKELDLFSAHADQPEFHGVFTFEGNQLVICFNKYPAPRPVSFTTSKGVTSLLTYYEREKG
jgi:uncharacterized protein (TIGR03067 family)